jgi:hypothetical protein
VKKKFSCCDCIELKPVVEVIDISGKDKGEHEEDNDFDGVNDEAR